MANPQEIIEAPIHAPTVAQAAEPNPMSIIQKAVEHGLDAAQLRELLELQREWRRDQAKVEFDKALAKFNGLKQVIKHNRTGEGPGRAKFGYSDFPTLADAVTPWLKECGLSFSHRQDEPAIGSDGRVAFVRVVCRVTHECGHSEEVAFPAMPDHRLAGKVSPSQLLQMAITYAKRQTLSMALGLATAEDCSDDDGTPAESAQETAQEQQSQDGRQPYPAARFADNLSKWASMIADGKATADRIIGMIESKATLTNQQKQAIKGLES